MLSWSCLSLIAIWVCAGTVYAASSQEEDERAIRSMAEQAISRLNQRDVTVFDDFWDEDADYVAVDGTLIRGRAQIQALFRRMARSDGMGKQSASVEQIRFITPEIATVDGSWTVTGARSTDGKELPPIQGRGFELALKKNGRWHFVATREMVVFRAN
jgi:uncharacterized protein (TIGR02246 family)